MRQVLATIILLLASSEALACSCARPEGTIEQQVSALYVSSSIVGIFEVGDRSASSRLANGKSKTRRWIELLPHRLFKGEPASLFTPAPPLLFRTSCDARLRRGDLVLVYASSTDPVSLSRCSPSDSLLNKFDHLPVLFSLSEQWR